MATIFERLSDFSLLIPPGKGPSRERIFDALRVYDQCICLFFGIQWVDSGQIKEDTLHVRVHQLEVLEREDRDSGYASRLIIVGEVDENNDKEKCGILINYSVSNRSGVATLSNKMSPTIRGDSSQSITLIKTPSAAELCDGLRMGYRDDVSVTVLGNIIGLFTITGARRLCHSHHCERWLFWGKMLACGDNRKFMMELDTNHRAGTFWYI